MFNMGRWIFRSLSWILEVYIWMIIIRIMTSWFNPSPSNSLIRLWFAVTDPGEAFLEKLVPTLAVMGNHCNDLVVFGILVTIVFARMAFRLMAEST